MVCCACNQPITDDQRHDAVCWLDPDDMAVVAHGICIAVYDEILAELLQDPCMEALYVRRPLDADRRDA